MCRASQEGPAHASIRRHAGTSFSGTIAASHTACVTPTAPLPAEHKHNRGRCPTRPRAGHGHSGTPSLAAGGPAIACSMSLPHSVPCRGRTGGPGALAVWSRHSSSGGLRRAQRSTRRQPSRRRRGTPESNRDVDKAAAALPQWLDPVDRAEPRAAARLQRHAEQCQLTSTTWPRTEDPKSARAPRAGPVQADGHFTPAAQHRSAPHAPPRTGQARCTPCCNSQLLSANTSHSKGERGYDSSRILRRPRIHLEDLP